MAQTLAPPARGRMRGLTGNVVALGFVSLFTDVSTEMIVPVLPLFVTRTLGAGVSSVGLIEGVAESTASLLRLASGWLSDRIGRRKPFLVLGYGLSGVSKATLALAASWPAVLLLRFSDRVGKGLRNPPRDALIADSVEPQYLGRAFGFHRALDNTGAAIGPLLAYALLRLWPAQYGRIFLTSAIPAVLSVAVLVLFVHGTRVALPGTRRALFADAAALGGPFHRFMLVAALFSLGNSSVAFLILLARAAGWADTTIPLLYLAFNLVAALLAWPVGELSDRIGRRPVLFAAYASFALVYGALSWHFDKPLVLAGFVLLGLHTALLDVSQRSMLGDLVPADQRGTAYGLYYTVVGIALLPASVIAGVLWDRVGPRAMLGADAVLAVSAAIAFALLLPRAGERGDRAPAA